MRHRHEQAPTDESQPAAGMVPAAPGGPGDVYSMGSETHRAHVMGNIEIVSVTPATRGGPARCHLHYLLGLCSACVQ